MLRNYGDLVCSNPAATAVLGYSKLSLVSNTVHAIVTYQPPAPVRCSYCGTLGHGSQCTPCGAPL